MKITQEMIDAAARGYWSDLYDIEAMRGVHRQLVANAQKDTEDSFKKALAAVAPLIIDACIEAATIPPMYYGGEGITSVHKMSYRIRGYNEAIDKIVATLQDLKEDIK